jgi:lysophospholipase L1-like esterase
LRLLVLGDSSAAGVGAPSQDEALSGRLVRALESDFDLSWRLEARTGATTAGTLRHLERLPGEAFDAVVVSLGLNDVTSRRPLDRWILDVDALVRTLRTRFSAGHVLLCGVPPMHALPALPHPLRWWLGTTARAFDDALAHWAGSRPWCEHVPLGVDRVAGRLATDGLHPGPALYLELATELASRIRAVGQASGRRSGSTQPVRAGQENSRSFE